MFPNQVHHYYSFPPYPNTNGVEVFGFDWHNNHNTLLIESILRERVAVG
jgi:hypothetical protein